MLLIDLRSKLCYNADALRINCFGTWACTGFDGDHAVGEAIRRAMRQIPNLNINAEDYDLALAA